MVDVPTEVRAPVVAATLEAPLERRLAHVADLDLIVDEALSQRTLPSPPRATPMPMSLSAIQLRVTRLLPGP